MDIEPLAILFHSSQPFTETAHFFVLGLDHQFPRLVCKAPFALDLYRSHALLEGSCFIIFPRQLFSLEGIEVPFLFYRSSDDPFIDIGDLLQGGCQQLFSVPVIEAVFALQLDQDHRIFLGIPHHDFFIGQGQDFLACLVDHALFPVFLHHGHMIGRKSRLSQGQRKSEQQNHLFSVHGKHLRFLALLYHRNPFVSREVFRLRCSGSVRRGPP